MQSHFKKTLVGAGAFASALLMLAGCASETGDAGSGGAAGGGTLTVGLGSGAICVDPQQTFNFSASAVARSVADSLTDQDPDTGEIVPWLAESWEVNDDATEYVFTLRDDVTYSDGTPLDAENVVANLDYIKGLGPKSSRGAAYLSNYASSEAVDEHTVKISFSAPSAQFLVGTSTLVFSMLSTSTTELTPEERCQGELVGTGPFVMESYVQDQEAIVTRRDGYAWPSALALHEGDAYLDGIDFLFQPVPNVRAGALASGQIDVAMAMETQDIATVEAAGATVDSGTMPGLPGSFFLNSTRPALADAAVREAIMIGFDREGIVQTVLGDYFNPAFSVLTSNLREYADFSDELTYDPDAAADLLDEAGWVAGADGVRSKDGVPLEVTFTYTEDYGPFYTSLLQLVQQQLNEIGFDITLNNTTSAGLVELQQTQDFDIFITTITESDPDMVRSMIQTRLPDTALVEELGMNPLFAEQLTVADPQARADVWAEIQQLVLENGLIVPFFEGTQLTGYSEDVTDVRFDFKSMVTFYDAQLN